MKSRMLVLIMVFFIAIGLVALIVKTFSHMLPDQGQVDQSNLTLAKAQLFAPENASGSENPIVQPVNNLSNNEDAYRTVRGL